MPPRKRTTTTTRTTPLTLKRCPHCRAPILRAFIDGIDSTLDPTPLNTIGALAADAAGITTYLRTNRTDATHRDRDRRNPQHHPPRTCIHMQHRCGYTIPQALLGTDHMNGRREIPDPNI